MPNGNSYIRSRQRGPRPTEYRPGSDWEQEYSLYEKSLYEPPFGGGGVMSGGVNWGAGGPNWPPAGAMLASEQPGLDVPFGESGNGMPRLQKGSQFLGFWG